MEKKEEFKNFVKDNPILIQSVRNNQMTWQKFYELFDLYGKDHEVWNDYLKPKEEIKKETPTNNGFDFLKNIDLDSIQSGVENLQRVLGLLGELSIKDTEPVKDTYKPRPLYKHFED